MWQIIILKFEKNFESELNLWLKNNPEWEPFSVIRTKGDFFDVSDKWEVFVKKYDSI